MDEPEPRTPQMEDEVAEEMAEASGLGPGPEAESALDCSCNVVAVLEAEAAFFRRASEAEEPESPAAVFFGLQAQYLGRLAERFRDGLSFARQMKAALQRP